MMNNFSNFVAATQQAAQQASQAVNNARQQVAPNAAQSASSTLLEKTPDDIPKDDLMQLCMKMQKRMQMMETKGKELVRKKAALLAERQQLLEIFRSPQLPIPSLVTGSDQDLELPAIEAVWREYQQHQSEKRIELEQQLLGQEERLRSELSTEISTQLQQQMEQRMADAIAEVEARYRAELDKREEQLRDAQQQSTAVSSGPAVDLLNSEPVDMPIGEAPLAMMPTISVQQHEQKLAESKAVVDRLQQELSNATSRFETLASEKKNVQASLADYQKRSLKADAEMERLRSVESYLKSQLTTMEGVIVAKNTELEEVQRASEKSNAVYEEKVVHLQLQIKALKERDEVRDKDSVDSRAAAEKQVARIQELQRLVEERDISITTNRDMIQALQARIIEVEPDLERARERIKELEQNSNASVMLKVEQDALTESLRQDMKRCLDEKDAALEKVKELEEFKVKAEGQLMKLSALSEQVNILQASIEDKTSLITRMRSEASANERNHAMRTAMLATCESQLETIQAELAEKEAEIKKSADEAAVAQQRAEQLEQQLQEKSANDTLMITELKKELENEKVESAAEVQRLTAAHEGLLEAMKKDHQKKSNVARALLSEREEEVRALSAKNQELMEEIQSGAPTERKIFELAQTQSRRDAVYGMHNDTRELAFQQLQTKLAARDHEIAVAQQQYKVLHHEVTELRRTRQRDGVNMDYLKNIVHQYMCFPTNCSEKSSLVPVIAMLLQFSAREVSQVHKAASEAASAAAVTGWSAWFGGSSARPVKEVKRPPPSPQIMKPNSKSTAPAATSAAASKPPTGKKSVRIGTSNTDEAGAMPGTDPSEGSATPSNSARDVSVAQYTPPNLADMSISSAITPLGSPNVNNSAASIARNAGSNNTLDSVELTDESDGKGSVHAAQKLSDERQYRSFSEGDPSIESRLHKLGDGGNGVAIIHSQSNDEESTMRLASESGGDRYVV